MQLSLYMKTSTQIPYINSIENLQDLNDNKNKNEIQKHALFNKVQLKTISFQICENVQSNLG